MSADAGHLPDWGLDPVRIPIGRQILAGAVVVVPLVAVAALFSLVSGWDWGGFALWLFTLVFAVGVFFAVGRARLLRSMHVKPLGPEGERFRNLVEGLAGRLKVRAPHLYVIEEGGPNAAVFHKRGPAIAVTRSLLETYARTEQEAVAAHCLVRLNSGHARVSALGALFDRGGSRFVPQVGTWDDISAAACTRYPPGLARAIEKARPIEGSWTPFWFVAHGSSHRPVTERVAALQDL